MSIYLAILATVAVCSLLGIEHRLHAIHIALLKRQ